MAQSRIYPVPIQRLASWLPAHIEHEDIRANKSFVVEWRDEVGKFHYEWDEEGYVPPNGVLILRKIAVDQKSESRVTLELRAEWLVWRAHEPSPPPAKAVAPPVLVFDLVALDDSSTELIIEGPNPKWPTLIAYRDKWLDKIAAAFAPTNEGTTETTNVQPTKSDALGKNRRGAPRMEDRANWEENVKMAREYYKDRQKGMGHEAAAGLAGFGSVDAAENVLKRMRSLGVPVSIERDTANRPPAPKQKPP